MIPKIKSLVTWTLRKISPAFHRQMVHKEKLLWSLPEEFLLKSPRTFVLGARDAGGLSLFFQVIGAIEFCQNGEHNLLVDFNTGYYLDTKKGDNWWRYDFETDQYPCKEALIECLLLSRCDILVRTDSNLSHACRLFSPKQKVIKLSE